MSWSSESLAVMASAAGGGVDRAAGQPRRGVGVGPRGVQCAAGVDENGSRGWRSRQSAGRGEDQIAAVDRRAARIAARSRQVESPPARFHEAADAGRGAGRHVGDGAARNGRCAVSAHGERGGRAARAEDDAGDARTAGGQRGDRRIGTGKVQRGGAGGRIDEQRAAAQGGVGLGDDRASAEGRAARVTVVGG